MKLAFGSHKGGSTAANVSFFRSLAEMLRVQQEADKKLRVEKDVAADLHGHLPNRATRVGIVWLILCICGCEW